MPIKREPQTKVFYLVLCKYNKAETDTNNDAEALNEYDKVHNTSDASKNPEREALSLKIHKSSTRHQVIKNRFGRCGPWEDFSEEDINRACLAEDLEKTRQEAFIKCALDEASAESTAAETELQEFNANHRSLNTSLRAKHSTLSKKAERTLSNTEQLYSVFSQQGRWADPKEWNKSMQYKK
ncbi:MAG: hypothetical protein Q9164_003662 [Protoblastenia rupestris]